MGHGCLHWQIHYKEAVAKCFASDSCGYQIILLQHTAKLLLLNVPVPRNKVYEEKYLYQVLEHILKFAMNISKKVISLTNCIMSLGKGDWLLHALS